VHGWNIPPPETTAPPPAAVTTEVVSPRSAPMRDTAGAMAAPGQGWVRTGHIPRLPNGFGSVDVAASLSEEDVEATANGGTGNGTRSSATASSGRGAVLAGYSVSTVANGFGAAAANGDGGRVL
jgi:hypothetical protein